MRSQTEEIEHLKRMIRLTLVMVACSVTCIACGVAAVFVLGEPIIVAALATIGAWQLLVCGRTVREWWGLRKHLRYAREKWDVYCLVRGKRPS